MVRVSESFIQQIAQMSMIRGMLGEFNVMECPVCSRRSLYTNRQPTPPINHVQGCAWIEARLLHNPTHIKQSNLCMEITLQCGPDMSHECVLGADTVMGVSLDVTRLDGGYQSVKVVLVYGNGKRRCVSIMHKRTWRFDKNDREFAERHARGIAEAWKTEYLGITTHSV